MNLLTFEELLEYVKASNENIDEFEEVKRLMDRMGGWQHLSNVLGTILTATEGVALMSVSYKDMAEGDPSTDGSVPVWGNKSLH